MSRLIQGLRSNAIAVLALVLAILALAGASYAAISIPAGSVGTRALRNGAVTSNKIARGSVTASKLNSRSIAGTIVFWAQIDQDGHVLKSSEPATTSGWSIGSGTVMFRARLSLKCFALGNVLALDGAGSVSAFAGGSVAGQAKVHVFMTPAGSTQIGPLPIALAVICPS
jgi:hypothetical protein